MLNPLDVFLVIRVYKSICCVFTIIVIAIMKHRIMLKCAHDLQPRDIDGKADPYCIIQFVDAFRRPVCSKRYISQVKAHTLSPKWNEVLNFGEEFGFHLASYIHIQVHYVFFVQYHPCSLFVCICIYIFIYIILYYIIYIVLLWVGLYRYLMPTLLFRIG